MHNYRTHPPVPAPLADAGLPHSFEPYAYRRWQQHNRLHLKLAGTTAAELPPPADRPAPAATPDGGIPGGLRDLQAWQRAMVKAGRLQRPPRQRISIRKTS